MPITILKGGRNNRQAFHFGCASALRATDNLVEQLREQLERERQQSAFNAAEWEREKRILIRDLAAALRDLARARYELAQRGVVDAFAAATSPSETIH